MPVWVTKKIKDPQFVSSVRNVAALIIFFIYYLILIVVSLFINQPWWSKLTAIVSLPFAGLFAFHYYIEAKKLWAKIRYNFMSWFKNKDLKELKQIYNDIIHKMDEITT